jgi:hypothetical protein
LSVEFVFLLLGFYGGSFIGIGLTEPPIYEVTSTYIEEVL